ncbi:DeoR/GlpR family DNA-binding transcription regulator [Inquilinus sp. CAU 1745]|uniref:DeoR/GlpR family DNA-binding transcription regulator n=1 Tax=Inquilinus sp. CAU 1745 TaxID=3140369 RepID=UPI00325B5CAB
MPSLQATLRHQSIVDFLHRDGNVHVADLAEKLQVSAVTIRADLDYLEEQQVLSRTRGGAVPARPRRFELPLEMTIQDHADEKKRIARLGASMVRSGETVILDVGSTTTELAKSLSRDLQDVVVVTNALNIALALENHSGVTVVVTGGTLRTMQHSLVAPFAALLLKEINADLAFIGCNGVDSEKGFTNTNLAEAEVKHAMIEAASRCVFLADHAKLMRVATARVAPLEAADLLITDEGATSEQLRALRRAGLEIAVA